MWSAIKSAINSNLGKPLNDLFNEQHINVSNLINSKLDDISTSSDDLGNLLDIKYEISEDVLYSIEPFEISVGSGYCKMVLIGKWIPKFDGFVKVKIAATKSVSDNLENYLGACQIPLNYILESFNSLNEIGDVYNTGSSLSGGQSIQTNNFHYYIANGTTNMTAEINLPVKAGIPLKIYLHAMYYTSNRRFSITECKVLGKEVIY